MHGNERACPEQGYNAAIIAYGQTGTGKTYTMEGEQHGPERGIIPRAVEDVFAYIENDTAPGSKYLVRASYLQIYNEVTLPIAFSNFACPHMLSSTTNQVGRTTSMHLFSGKPYRLELLRVRDWCACRLFRTC